MYWSARERKLSLDGQPVRKLTEYLGAVRVVVFCTEDVQLVKGRRVAGGGFSTFCSRKLTRLICRCSSATRRRSAHATRC